MPVHRKWHPIRICHVLLLATKVMESASVLWESSSDNLTRSQYILERNNSDSTTGEHQVPCFRNLTDNGVNCHQGIDSRSFYRHDENDTDEKNSSVYWNAQDNVGAKNDSCPKVKDRACIPLCCPLQHRLLRNNCVKVNGTYEFPKVYDPDTLTLANQTVNEQSFELFNWDPCNGSERYQLIPEELKEDSFMLLGNGSLYQNNLHHLLNHTQYCLGIVENDTYDVLLCFDDVLEEELALKSTVGFPVGLVVSVPFLLATFLVYSLIPDLKNMHGRTLRGYVGSLLVAYVVLAFIQLTPQEMVSDTLCITLAFTIHFSFLASFFWLNVMCFDIWWTFGGFRSLQGSVKQRERKKFIIYSIYAWGAASILTGVCIIVEFVPGIPDHFIKPQFGLESCWFTTDVARAVYFYGPMGVTVFCNICLFVSTALKILRHKKDTAHHLKGTDSRRHDDNKQWFNLYLKLFIVMGINWSMEIVSWLCEDSPEYIWYITDLTNTLQGVIIFLIFVWKDKIKRLLLKKFGCQGRDVLSRNSTRSVYHSSASRTCTTFAAPLQEKINPYSSEAPYSGRRPSNDSDCA